MTIERGPNAGRPIGRILLLVGAAAAAIVLFLVLQRDDEGDSTASTASTPTATQTTTPTTSTRPTTTTPAVTVARITVSDGKAVGGIRRIDVEEGDRVELRVRSDVADEVHVHGYDLKRDVAPGKPARIAFRATIPGRFDVELEERALPIAELDVRP